MGSECWDERGEVRGGRGQGGMSIWLTANGKVGRGREGSMREERDFYLVEKSKGRKKNFV